MKRAKQMKRSKTSTTLPRETPLHYLTEFGTFTESAFVKLIPRPRCHGKPSFVIEPIIKLKTSSEIVDDIRHYIMSWNNPQ